MKKVISIISTIIVFLVIVAVGLYAYYGGFETVVFKEKQQGGEVLVYKEVLGDYSQTPQVTDEIYKKLTSEFGIDSSKLISGFGIFYDNPNADSTTQLRSDVGCILDASELSKLSELAYIYKVKTFPAGIYTSVEFPYKGQLSIFVGMMKFYSAFAKLTEEGSPIYNGGPIMEIYNMRDSVLTYRICGVELDKKSIKAIKYIPTASLQ